MDGGLAPGAYESLHTAELEERLRLLVGVTPHFQALDPTDAPDVLARHVAAVLRRMLVAEKDPQQRSQIVAEVLDVLGASDQQPTSRWSNSSPSSSSEVGQASARSCGPSLRLSNAALLTNSQGEPNLGAELRARCPAQITWICSAHSSAGRAACPRRGSGGPQGARGPAPRHHHDVHRRHRASGRRRARPPLRRRGAHQLRDAIHAAARQGMALQTELRLRHRLRRKLQPLPCCAARRPGVERAPVRSRHARAPAQVRSHVRHLLGRRRLRAATTRIETRIV